MNPYDHSTWTYGAPIVDALIMGNWGYIPYKWSDSPILITVDGAHFVALLIFKVNIFPNHKNTQKRKSWTSYCR